MFRILTVCSGNLCRSPIAEQVLRAGLSDIPEIQVASAGTMAVNGDPMPEQAARLSIRLGGDPLRHTARLIDESLISQADLILVAAREHRSAVASMLPRANRKTFTLREFARLAESGDRWSTSLLVDVPRPAALPGFVAELAARRGGVPPVEPDDDDVVDPYRRDDAVYEMAGAQLGPALDIIVRHLRQAAGS